MSALSMTFKLQERTHEWGRTGTPLQACDPCDSEPVKTSFLGYLKTLAAAEQETKGAVPFTKEMVVLLLKRLLQRFFIEAMQLSEMGVQQATTAQLLAA